jgi:hypothetical protein
MVDRQPYGLVLPSIERSSLPPSVFGETRPWDALAQSLATNVEGTLSPPTAVVLRSGLSPRLAVLGWATPEEQDALEAALDLFVGSLSRLRPVDYAQAEDDCRGLAEKLHERLPAEVLDDAVFAGIPRGGTIVEGMLRYVLDLPPEQLNPQARPEAPLVVVDDCFLTGHQADCFLAERPPRSEVVLAGLYAHPDLRSAIERDHPAVRACVTARDLTDHAPDLYGDDYADWTERWESRLGDTRYWIGVPDHLCFPWSEPDVGFWNPATDTLEQGWRVAPPGRCLDRRSEDASAPVFVQEPPPAAPERTLFPGPDVFYAEVDAHTIVAHASSETCLALEDPAADFWWALVEHGRTDNARDALLSRYDVAPDRLDADLRDFVQTALGRDLLEDTRASPPS